MKYYERTITKREAINRFGKLGYVAYTEYFKTNDEKFVEKMNKGKKIKFDEVNRTNKFLHIDKNKLYEEKLPR